MKKRIYNSQTPFIIPVFIPHAGCPHQCVFCNQKSITGNLSSDSSKPFDDIVKTFLSYNLHEDRKIQISFYGGTFLGLDDDIIIEYLDKANQWIENGKVDSIRFSTRPDSISYEKLNLIKKYPVETIEIGVQSMDEYVLNKSGRGHSPYHTQKAVELLKTRGYEIGIQIMTGLPGDTENKSIKTALAVVDLKPDFVRIYPCVVIKDSPLALMYLKGEYEPFSLEKTVELVKTLYMLFRKNSISIARMGLQSSTELSSPDGDSQGDLIAGPYHPAFGHMIFSAIFFHMAVTLITGKLIAGKLMTGDSKNACNIDVIDIEVNSRSFSKFRGLNNANIFKLKEKFNLRRINIKGNEKIKEDGISIYGYTIDIDKLCWEGL